ncbi:MAG TPA: DUF1318 domain-containing protein [Desulfobacterales bacterium]|nr:DUF1318 domain-containing protein [Desulfobacterales bacterium]
MTRPRVFLLSLFVLLTAATACQAAASINEIKARMLARLPTINALKAKGVVGENNRGLLEYRSSDRPQAEVVEAENADRLAVYRAIAQKQGVDPSLVGARRARQIAAKALPGTWLQNEQGQWYQK